MRLVVTGGTGFVGRHLRAELARRGDRVTARHPPRDASPFEGIGFAEWRPESLEPVLRAPLGVPPWIMTLRFGEGAEPLVTRQRVGPPELEERGFEFRHPRVTDALADLFGRAGGSRC